MLAEIWADELATVWGIPKETAKVCLFDFLACMGIKPHEAKVQDLHFASMLISVANKAPSERN